MNVTTQLTSSQLASSHSTDDVGRLLLEIGTLLLSSGATTERIRLTIHRFSEYFGFRSEVLITHQAIMLTMNQHEKQVYSHLKRSPRFVTNFKILSGISRLSWATVNQQLTIDQIWADLHRLKGLTPYPRWLVVTMVSLSGASFCRLFGGNGPSMFVTFAATAVGFLTLQTLIRKSFNHYLCIFAASFMASLIAEGSLVLLAEKIREHSMAASILFLVPGIALINSFTDLLDGNLLNGLLRGLNAFMVAFCMAIGWMWAVTLVGFWS